MKKEFDLKKLSEHLFWDVDKDKLDFEKNKKFIIGRVLQYGLFDDWQEILKLYGIKNIAKISTKIRGLDKKTSSYIALLSNTPKEQFLCYTTTQSKNQLWNF